MLITQMRLLKNVVHLSFIYCIQYLLITFGILNAIDVQLEQGKFYCVAKVTEMKIWHENKN